MGRLLAVALSACLVLSVAFAADSVGDAVKLIEEVKDIAKIEDVIPGPETRITPIQLKMFLKAWMEVERKKQFLKLPNYDFGCTNQINSQVSTNYSFFQYGSCIWRDAKNLPNVQSITDWSNDEAIPVIVNLSFPFFGTYYRGPQILMVASNGIVTVGYEQKADKSNPNLTNGAEPFNVITAVWSSMQAPSGATVYYGNFRMGLKVECIVFQWEGFVTQSNQDPVDIQLDICNNGEFTSRVLLATDLNKSDVGLKDSQGNGESIGPFVLGYDWPSNSAIIMTPN